MLPLLGLESQGEGAAGDASFKGKGQHASGKPLAAKKTRHDAQRREQEKKRRQKEQEEAAAVGGTAKKVAAAHTLSVDSRLLSALLTGINRAFPYVDADKVDALVERVAPHIFRIAHAQSLHGAVQALTLLLQMMSARSASSDRFYRALYEVQLVRVTRTLETNAPFLPSRLGGDSLHPIHLLRWFIGVPHLRRSSSPILSFGFSPRLVVFRRASEPGPAEERLGGDVPVAAVQGDEVGR